MEEVLVTLLVVCDAILENLKLHLAAPPSAPYAKGLDEFYKMLVARALKPRFTQRKWRMMLRICRASFRPDVLHDTVLPLMMKALTEAASIKRRRLRGPT